MKLLRRHIVSTYGYALVTSDDFIAKELDTQRQKYSDLEKDYLRLKTENEKLGLELDNRGEKIDADKATIEELRTQITEYKAQLEESKSDQRHHITQFTEIQKKYEEASRDLVGLRAEIKRSDEEKIELRTQLDNKISLLCAKEQELRDMKVEKLEKVEIKETIRPLSTAEFSRSLERDCYIPY